MNKAIAALVIAAVIVSGIGIGAVYAQAQGPFGSVQEELQRIAGRQPQRFMEALRTAFQSLDATNKTAFKGALLTELELDTWAADQEKVRALEDIKKRVANIADNPDDVMAAILGVIQITQPESP